MTQVGEVGAGAGASSGGSSNGTVTAGAGGKFGRGGGPSFAGASPGGAPGAGAGGSAATAGTDGSAGSAGTSGSEAGSAGVGGSAGQIPLGSKCFQDGLQACDNTLNTLDRCQGGVWQLDTACTLTQKCRPDTHVCQPVPKQCVGKRPGQFVCDGNDVFACSGDLLSGVVIDVCQNTACVASDFSANCGPSKCGNGMLDAKEPCDDGNADESDACTSSCEQAVCGDGLLWATHEECDDHNQQSGDGCSASCKAEQGPAQVFAGRQSTCTVGVAGNLKCWGDNDRGQLGRGDTVQIGDAPDQLGKTLASIDLGPGLKVAKLAMGYGYVCALFTTSAVKCWGANDAGALGLGDANDRGDEAGEMGSALPFLNFGAGRSVTAIAAADQHACVILDNGKVKCWGANDGGQLGLGNVQSHGSQPNEMGDALPYVDLGTGRTALAIAAADSHTCVILDDHSVRCWGAYGGSLGLGTLDAKGDDEGEMGDALPPVNLGTGRTALAIAVGGGSNCARLDNNDFKCWGENGSGQLGLGNSSTVGDHPNKMGNALPALSLGSGLVAQSVKLGDQFMCALLTGGSVKCWGAGSRLGDETNVNRGDLPGQMGDAMPSVALGAGRSAVSLSVGADHTCVILDDGALKCWGYNDYGQLGHGDTLLVGDQPQQMGDWLSATALVF